MLFVASTPLSLRATSVQPRSVLPQTLPGIFPVCHPLRELTAVGRRSGTSSSRSLGLSDGTFRAELLDIAVGESYVVAVQHATADAHGRSLDITGCQLMRITDGLISEVRGHYSDQAALDAFWLT